MTLETRTPEKPPPAVVAQGMHRPTVLLVEDSYEGQLLIKHYIKDKYEIVTVATGEKALEAVVENDVKAILMDLHLAGAMTGLQTTAQIRTMPEKNALPIIALTAFATEDTRDRCFQAGCNEYIPKPASKQKILSVLEQFIG